MSLQLYVWPAAWGLPSLDAPSLSVILYSQLAFPANFSIIECVDPDLSPTGQLPFLIHGLHTVAGVAPIIAYLSTLALEVDESKSTPTPNLDAALSTLQLSQRTAWRAYVESHLGVLVAHSFYSLSPNYSELTRPTLASLMPVPSRYYVPDRLRQTWKPRLEAAGLWAIEAESEEQIGKVTRKKDITHDEFKRAFAKEKTLEKARLPLNILSNLLSNRSFIFQDRPTSLDLVLASYILVILNAPLPNPLVASLLKDEYPNLVDHARLILSLAFPEDASTKFKLAPSVTKAPSLSLFTTFTRSISRLLTITRNPTPKKPRTEVQKAFDRRRWVWYMLAATGTLGYIGYVLASGLVKVEIVKEEESEEEE